MSLSTANDYKGFLYKFIHSVKNSRGLDIEELYRMEGVSQADVSQVVSEYKTYEQTLTSRIAKTTQAAK